MTLKLKNVIVALSVIIISLSTKSGIAQAIIGVVSGACPVQTSILVMFIPMNQILDAEGMGPTGQSLVVQ